MNNFYLKNNVNLTWHGAWLMRMLSLILLLAAVVVPTEAKVAAAGSEVSNEVVTYDLKLCNVVVTSENCNDIQFGQERGTASYDAETKTLTIDSVYVLSGKLYSEIDGLKIKIKGNVIWGINNSSISIQLRANTIIDGSESTYFSFEMLSIGNNTEVVLRNFDNARCNYIYGASDVANIKLVVENSNLKVANLLTRIVSLTLNNCELPEGVVFNEARYTVLSENGEFVPGFAITKPKEYDLWICGVRVTNKNMNDLSKLPGVTKGAISYDEAENALILKQCSIESPEGVSVIRSNMKNLWINADDSNSNLIAKGAPVLKFEKGWSCIRTLAGGSLSLSTSDDQPAILATDSLKFYYADVVASGKYGVAGSGNGVYLEVNSGKVKLYGKESATNNLSGCEKRYLLVKSPQGAEYDSVLRGFAVGGKLVSDTLFLGMDWYDVAIGGIQLNEANYKNLSTLPYVQGKVSYEPSTNTLTLENATLSKGIAFYNDDATIVVKGKCVIDFMYGEDDYCGLLFDEIKNANIRGVDGGELKIKVSCLDEYLDNSVGINFKTYGLKSDLNIDNCDMEITALYPFMSDESDSETPDFYSAKLCVNNSNMKINTNSYAVLFFRGVELSGCKINSPQNVKYIEGKTFYLEDKEIFYAGNLVIERDNAVGIENIKPEVPAARRGVYTIDGVKLDTSEENLPAGVYIINGKKVLKK